MANFQYFIECEKGYDPSGRIRAVLAENKYSAELELDHNNHWFYETPRKLTKKVVSRINALPGVREIFNLEQLASAKPGVPVLHPRARVKPVLVDIALM